MTLPTQPVPILMYHSISDAGTPGFSDFVVSPERFDEHLGALREAGFVGITMAELAAARRGEGELPRGAVAITFDDGFKDFVDSAVPALERHMFTSTLYVTTRYVGGRSRWLVEEEETGRPMLEWSDLTGIVAAGHEIGAHSETHPQLDLLSDTALARELTVPKRDLEDHLGTAVTSMAYPFGYATKRVRAMTAHLGYDNACVVSDLVSFQEDQFSVPRLTVTPDLTAADVVDLAASRSDGRARAVSSARRQTSRVLRRAGLKKRSSARYSRSLR